MKANFSNQVSADAGYHWIVAYIAILAAGGLFLAIKGVLLGFGIFKGFLLGLVAGPFVAGFFALLTIPSVAAITWALCLSRFPIIAAAVAGAVTGVVPLFLVLYLDDLNVDSHFYADVIMAGYIGVVVPGLATAYYMRRRRQQHMAEGRPESPVFQISPHSLFLRMTVLAMVVVAWSAAIAVCLHSH